MLQNLSSAAVVIDALGLKKITGFILFDTSILSLNFFYKKDDFEKNLQTTKQKILKNYLSCKE